MIFKYLWLCLVALLALTACSVREGDAVRTKEQAIAIAERECGKPGKNSHGWLVTYHFGNWHLELDYVTSVSIRSSDGKVTGCTVVVG